MQQDKVWQKAFPLITNYLKNENELIQETEFETTILPPVGKEYTCFQNNSKTYQASRCIKSRIMTKAIDYVISFYKF